MKDRKQLFVIAGLACVAVLVAGWFLLVSPTKAKAADLRSTASTTATANDSLRAQIASLRALAASLPQQQAELNRLLQKVPTQAELPTLIRQLTDTAGKAQVTITALTPQKPAPLPGVAGVQGVDLAITAKGDYVELEQFLQGLESMPRAFLVQGVSLGSGASGSSSAATPAATADATGGITATLSGRVLVRSATTGTAGS